MVPRLWLVCCGPSLLLSLRRAAAQWVVAATVWGVSALPGAAQQPAAEPAASPAPFVLLSNANKPAEIVGKILYADNTLPSDLADGTYSAEKRSGGGSDGNAYTTI